jgi:hypothetical protein
MKLRSNPWVSGFIIMIVGILIGLLIPYIQYIISDPSVEIVYPVSGEKVYWDPEGSSIVGTYWKLEDDRIYVLLHSTGTDLWYVQSQATILNEKLWRAKAYYGTKPEEDGQFEVRAIMTDKHLKNGDTYKLRELEGMRTKAKSKVATINKIPTARVTPTPTPAPTTTPTPIPSPSPTSTPSPSPTPSPISVTPTPTPSPTPTPTPAPTTTPTPIPSPSPTPTPTPSPTPTPVTRECEYPGGSTVGQMIPRSNASGSKVHGQFGCEGAEPWSAKAGYVRYNINLPSSAPIYLVLRYSKNSEPVTPIRIYIDEETQPRATFTPENQGDWEGFTETEPIYLGQITSGTHNLTLSTDGQQYGVTELDKFILSYSG